jgi:hypothetical protein
MYVRMLHFQIEERRLFIKSYINLEEKGGKSNNINFDYLSPLISYLYQRKKLIIFKQNNSRATFFCTICRTKEKERHILLTSYFLLVFPTIKILIYRVIGLLLSKVTTVT